ncbi:MAG: hypothetical protein NTZ05_18745 [Chloroflexi bacterium]|nr:hypothetical protein [Chloroflexota bacterium]
MSGTIRLTNKLNGTVQEMEAHSVAFGPVTAEIERVGDGSVACGATLTVSLRYTVIEICDDGVEVVGRAAEERASSAV